VNFAATKKKSKKIKKNQKKSEKIKKIKLHLALNNLQNDFVRL
jgi:hypothetical protein